MLQLAIERETLSLRPKTTQLAFFGEPNEDGEISGYRIEKGWDDAKEKAGIRIFASTIFATNP